MQAQSLNRVILVGRVGREPEITHIPSAGKNVAKFSLATTEIFRDSESEGNWREITEWHNVVGWGDGLAKYIERNVHKGIMVAVEGKIKTRKWQDKESGKNRSTKDIVIESITALSKGKKEESDFTDSAEPF